MAPLDTTRILDTLKSAIVVLNNNLILCYVNTTAEEMFANSKSWMLGKSFKQLFSAIEDSTITIKLDHFTRQPQAITEHEAQITLQDGRSLVVDYSIYPVDDQHQNAAILVEIRPLERQVEIAREEMSDLKKQATQQFARGMAHEIRNPLGGIRGAAQLLEREISDSRLSEYTDVIIHEVDRLDTLINSMLGPRTAMTTKRVNIHEILDHIRKLILASADGRVTISMDYDPSIPELLADKDQLTQVFLNIARNALQAIEQDGNIDFKTRIARRVTIGKTNHPLVVRVDISDTGKGVSAEISDTIFLPMVTDKADGSGLGLPIAQEIVSRHGGIIRFESSHSGTTFSTLLPLEIDS